MNRTFLGQFPWSTDCEAPAAQRSSYSGNLLGDLNDLGRFDLQKECNVPPNLFFSLEDCNLKRT